VNDGQAADSGGSGGGGGGRCKCPTCQGDLCGTSSAKKSRANTSSSGSAGVAADGKSAPGTTSKSHVPMLGTSSVRYAKTVLADAQRKVHPDGRVAYKDAYITHISAMSAYGSKSPEELAWEDRWLKDEGLKKVKSKLDLEMRDRKREAVERAKMNRNETQTKLWAAAFALAWGYYQDGLVDFAKGTAVSKGTASELFSLALQTCITGPHAVQCFFHRALCSLLENPSQAMSDLRVVLQTRKKDASAHYHLGSILLTHTQPNPDKDNPFEEAQIHLEQAQQLDAQAFNSDEGKLAELASAKEKAAHQRLVLSADRQKNLGNAALARGSFAEAEDYYSQAYSVCPTGSRSFIYLCNRATARCELAKLQPTRATNEALLKQAVEDCDACLASNPAYVKALFRRGKAYSSIGKLDEALKDFKSALEIEPVNASVKNQVVAVRKKMKEQSEKDKLVFGKMFASPPVVSKKLKEDEAPIIEQGESTKEDEAPIIEQGESTPAQEAPVGMEVEAAGDASAQ